MKKLLCVLLVLTMTFSMSITVFAAMTDLDNWAMTSENIEDRTVYIDSTINVSDNSGDRAAVVYHVNIRWTMIPGDLVFKGGRTYTWNAGTLSYEYVDTEERTVDSVSDKTEVLVKVTNYSNADVQCDIVADIVESDDFSVDLYPGNIPQDMLEGATPTNATNEKWDEGRFSWLLSRADAELKNNVTVDNPDGDIVMLTNVPDGTADISSVENHYAPCLAFAADLIVHNFGKYMEGGTVPLNSNTTICTFTVTLSIPE